MSILLDALRKSEEQRTLGGAPSIHSAVPGARPGSRSRHWLMLVMLGLTAAAVAWFGWQQFEDPAPGAGRAETAQTQPSDPESAARDAPVEKPARFEPQPRSDDPAFRTPVEDYQSAGLEEAAPADEEAGDRPTLSRSIADYSLEEDPGLAAEEGRPAGPDDDWAADEAFATIDELEAPETERTSRRELAGREPISYWQVPQSLRSTMPEFKITVLVYSEVPEDRFLLINGKRLRESEELADGVLLEEIRREGAVFTYRNYRFLVNG